MHPNDLFTADVHDPLRRPSSRAHRPARPPSGSPTRSLAFLPAAHFDVVHAHSVFSHSPLEIIEECLAHVGRVMKPGGFFDFTFDRTEGTEHQVDLREDFYYRTETLVALAERRGLTGQFMTDWEELPHQQSKLRITRPGGLRYISIT